MFLDEQVHGVGRPVGAAGAVVVEDGIAPAPQGAGEAGELGDAGVVALGDHRVEEPGRLVRVLDRVDLPKVFLRQPCGQNVVMRISPAQGVDQACPAPLAQALGAGDEDLADVIERVAPPAPVAGEVTLGAPTHVVDGPVAEVGSDQGAVPASRLVRLPGPPPEPDVRLPPHPALHEPMPLDYATSETMSPLHGVGITAPR